METTKQISIKNQNYYFHNDSTDIETFDSNLVTIRQKTCKNLDIYSIGHVTIKKLVIVMILIV